MEYDHDVYYMRSNQSATTEIETSQCQSFTPKQKKQLQQYQKSRQPKSILMSSGRSPSLERRRRRKRSVTFAETIANGKEAHNGYYYYYTTTVSANRFVTEFYESVRIKPPTPEIPFDSSAANQFVSQFYQSVKISPLSSAIPFKPSLSGIVEMPPAEEKTPRCCHMQRCICSMLVTRSHR